MAGLILLVEADFVLGAVLGEVLRHSGYEVTFMRSLKGEVERKHPISAVVLDVDTLSADKEITLLELLEQYGEDLPLILIGLLVPGTVHHHLRAHLQKLESNHPKHVAWVRKPFRNEELIAAVRRVHDHHPMVCSEHK
ncbi:hypothetical protein W02_33160 [Nitrospira sp. KM1]|uniref:response regulator transcription factor n=1 Tax=Nitrospira sp. KM1 TaxID=1936990 RepID=UPI0013A71EB0|nr:response regulator transcription factor [Nitrospira sp. KM1]BCA56176.1 hypothetical protein W02_33160 [Nitrospira sp. KM1]